MDTRKEDSAMVLISVERRNNDQLPTAVIGSQLDTGYAHFLPLDQFVEIATENFKV